MFFVVKSPRIWRLLLYSKHMRFHTVLHNLLQCWLETGLNSSNSSSSSGTRQKRLSLHNHRSSELWQVLNFGVRFDFIDAMFSLRLARNKNLPREEQLPPGRGRRGHIHVLLRESLDSERKHCSVPTIACATAPHSGCKAGSSASQHGIGLS